MRVLLLLVVVMVVAAAADVPLPVPPAMSCLACLECAREAGTTVGCVETCARHRLPSEVCRSTCEALAAPGASCAGLGLCPHSRTEAQQHEKRVFGVHGKGEPAVVLS